MHPVITFHGSAYMPRPDSWPPEADRLIWTDKTHLTDTTDTTDTNT
jgi:hypothetical protein